MQKEITSIADTTIPEPRKSTFVDVDVLQDLTRNSHKLYKADSTIVPIVIALCGFSERAITFAKGSNMLLFSLSEIMEWASKYL